MSLIGLACVLLVGCGTNSSVKTGQKATIRLTINWPKPKRAIDPTADTITLTVSSASKVVDTETITKPADGSASQIAISVPLQKTRLDAVAFNSASPNTILDQGGAPSDPSSYLQLTPGGPNTENIVLGPASKYYLTFGYIDPVTGSETVKNTVTAIYDIGYLYSTIYDQANHLLYMSGQNPDYAENAQYRLVNRLVTIDTLSGNTVSNINLSQPVSYLGYDSVNQILFGLIRNTTPIQFSHIDPKLGIVTAKSQVSGFYSFESIEATAFDQANHILYIAGKAESATGQSLIDRLVTVDTIAGNTLSNVILSQPVSHLGYDSVNQILFGFTSYPAGPVNVEFSYVDPSTGSITVKSQLTALYNRDYIFATAYDQANHLLYISGQNPNYTDRTVYRMVTIDTITGNTLRDTGLPQPIYYIEYDSTNQILFGILAGYK